MSEPTFQELYKNHMEVMSKELEAKPLFDARGKRVQTQASLAATVPLPIRPQSLFLVEDDPFGGNDNNRRVAERAAADRALVKGKIKTEQRDEIHAELVKKEHAALKAAAGIEQDVTADGKPVWKNNS